MRFSPKLIAALLALALPGMAQVTMGGGVSAGGGTLMCVPSTVGAPVFSPAPGTYSTPQTVTITCPIAGQTAVVRSDGGFVSAASPLYTGPMTTSVTTTYQTECVTFGGTTGNLTYQANTQASNTGFVCHTAAGGTYTGPPSITCTSSGGVIGSPTNVVASFPGGSSPATFTVTTPATSGTQTQDLNVFQFGGSLDPSASTCDNCTSEVKDIVFTVVGAGMANQENDMPQYDPTHGNTDRQNGTQCQGYGSGAIIAVDSGNAGGWTTTPISCSNWTAGTKHEIVNRVDHDLTGSCPGGNGCALYRYYVIDNVYNAMSGNYGNTQGYNNNSGAAWGWQFQPDMKTTSGTAATGGWTVSSATVALTMGDDTATVTGTYTINPIGSATPLLAPFLVTTQLGNNANPAPTTSTTGHWAGCAGTNPCLIFGDQKTSVASMAVPISINNCVNALNSRCAASGSSSLTVTSMVISGTNASDFSVSGSCSTVAVGSYCSPTVTFTPGAAGARSATLTVNYSGATVTSQTMSLTGTGVASPTLLTACGTLASSTNYELSQNVSATASCFIFNGTNSDLNLNGHTITYCSAGGTGLVGGIFVNGFSEKGLMVHNGYIAEASGKTCTGTTGTNGFGSAPFMVSSTGSTSDGKGNGFWNLTLTTNDAPGNAIFEEGAGASGYVSIVHDVNLVLTGTYNCPLSDVGCRSADQFYGIVEDQNQNAAAWNWYDIGQTGGTQGGLSPLSPGSTVSYTAMSPGSTVATNSNGFAVQTWQTGTVKNNFATGTGVGGSLLSARGGQLASVNGALTGALIENNTFISTYLANNDEYAGCALGGAYAYQLNTVGNGNDLSNNTVENNWFQTYSGVCPSYAFSDSGSTIAAGTNNLIGNHIEADIWPATYVSGNDAAAIRLDSCQYSPCPANAITFTGNTILGDTADIFVLNTGARTFAQDTFGKGTNPLSGQLFMNFNNGINTGIGSGLITIIDPVFLNGVTKSSNNLATWATNNPSYSAYYGIEWTYTVTVEQSSNSAPISGAAVTITPSNSGPVCSATTNGSGIATCILPDTLYQSVTGTYSTVSYNPMAIQVTASGCTTYTNSETITATTAETKKLSGC